jgi:hypothetical protein
MQDGSWPNFYVYKIENLGTLELINVIIYLVGCNTLSFAGKQPMIRRKISPPSSESKTEQNSSFKHVTSNIQYFSETAVDLQPTKFRHVSEDINLEM